MRPHGSIEMLEQRRRLAVERLLDGDEPREIADFLGVHRTSVYRWLRSYRQVGPPGLSPVAAAGRPPKLTAAQAAEMLSWLKDDPEQFGFVGQCWTAPRLAIVLGRLLGVHLHPRYLNDWLSRHGISPQIPHRQARERDAAAIARWVERGWPRIKKEPRRAGPRWPSATRAGC